MQKTVDAAALRQSGVVKLRGDDLFSVWVKTSCCNLNAAQLRKLAEISDKYARGYVLFSTRQIPIIPFIKLADVEAVKSELAAVYLELDRCGPRVRNVNVCYSPDICPKAVTDPISLAEKLDAFFRDAIVHKIKLGVSGCREDCTCARVLSDIGFVGVTLGERPGYDAYIGGRLGINPFIGVKIAGCVSEEAAVRLVQNYFALLRTEGRPGERAADIVERMGIDSLRQRLNAETSEGLAAEPAKCQTRTRGDQKGACVLRVRATCGEVSSEELLAIADVSERYGGGFVHFPVRGSPEIPGIAPAELPQVRLKLSRSGLTIIEEGIDNIQSCYGGYCTESLANPQPLLRRIEKRANELGVSNPGITISASGCPNSCGIPHLSDLGFYGVVEPAVDAASCTGCGICTAVCRRNAITIENNIAVIDGGKCAYCGACIASCPSGGILEKRRGFAAVVGGSGGERTRLGRVIARFLTDEEAYRVAEKYLLLAETSGTTAAALIDEVGIVGVKALMRLALLDKQETR